MYTGEVVKVLQIFILSTKYLKIKWNEIIMQYFFPIWFYVTHMLIGWDA